MGWRTLYLLKVSLDRGHVWITSTNSILSKIYNYFQIGSRKEKGTHCSDSSVQIIRMNEKQKMTQTQQVSEEVIGPKMHIKIQLQSHKIVLR